MNEFFAVQLDSRENRRLYGQRGQKPKQRKQREVTSWTQLKRKYTAHWVWFNGKPAIVISKGGSGMVGDRLMSWSSIALIIENKGAAFESRHFICSMPPGHRCNHSHKTKDGGHKLPNGSWWVPY